MRGPQVGTARLARRGGTASRMAAWAALAVVAVVAAAPAVGAAELRVQAELPKVAATGKAETLTVRLVGPDGTPAPAPRDLAVTVVVAGEEQRLQARLPAGASQVTLELTSAVPKARTLEIVVEGLEPAWVPWVVVPAEKARAAQAIEVGGQALRTLRQVTAPPVADSPATVQAAPPPPAEDRSALADPSAPRGAGASPTAATGAGESARRPRSSAADRWRNVIGQIGTLAGQEEALVFDAAVTPPPPEADAPAAIPAAAGELRFHSPKLTLRPGSDGRYRQKVFATWWVDGSPANPGQEVRAMLAVNPGESDLGVEPQHLVVAATTDTGSIDLVASRRGTAEVSLLHPRGAPLTVELLPAEPRAVRFLPGQVTELRRLGPGQVWVAAELLGDTLRPTPAPIDLELSFTALDGATAAVCRALVPAGLREGGCTLELSRFGDYELWVRGPGLDAHSGRIAFGFDFALLAWVLLGGLVGSVVQVVRHRVGSREMRLKRYLIGTAAALVVVLLLAFGGLVWLDWTLPDGLRDAAAGSSQSGLFLLGLLGGLAGDAVFSALDRRFGWTTRGGGAGGGTTPREEPPATPAPAPSGG
jgi:hypothetical protein